MLYEYIISYILHVILIFNMTNANIILREYVSMPFLTSYIILASPNYKFLIVNLPYRTYNGLNKKIRIYRHLEKS